MAKHYLMRMVDGWIQELPQREALNIIKRSCGGGGVMIRALKQGGMIQSAHVVGIQVVDDEDRFEDMKRLLVNLCPLPGVKIPQVDSTRAFVEELGAPKLDEHPDVPDENLLASGPAFTGAPETVDAPPASDQVVSGMTNADFKEIFDKAGLGQVKFSDKLNVKRYIVRAVLKNDRPVDEELAVAVKKAFPE